jgi:hypothetical protein
VPKEDATPNKKRLPEQVLITKERIIEQEIPQFRREEIRKYLELFGYRPEYTILQVHEAGSFGRGLRPARELAARARAAARYGGRTFVVVGRTHSTEFLRKLIPPKKQSESSPGYLGYLFQKKDQDKKAPDELLPLDFTPTPLCYPRDWEDTLGEPAYLITMHVPTDFARRKNELIRRLGRIRGDVSVKKEWKFLEELGEFGYDMVRTNSKRP